MLKHYVKNHLKINYVESRIHVGVDHLCFCKDFTNQTITFINSKVVYFMNHLTYQILHPQETKLLLPLNNLYRHQTIKIAVGTMAGRLHN